jgi:hypothetical protein
VAGDGGGDLLEQALRPRRRPSRQDQQKQQETSG